tara:strand:- start:2505 stop:3023 length:519 start_codon:yes stop_codon:yes gene_type:complete
MLFTWATVYGCASVLEWALHRHLMHDSKTRLGKFHLAHHAETLQDMSLRGDESPYLSAQEWRGTGFSWRMTRRLLVPIVTLALAVGWLLDDVGVAVCATSILFAYSLAAWNAIHPALHGMPRPPLSYGPSLPLWIPWQAYLLRHHTRHHLAHGRSNFNITLPGADVVFGTLA